MSETRRSDFLHGLPMSNASSFVDPQQLSPANRLRLIHDYVTSSPQDGGLGIVPCSEWDLVDSVMALHDRKFDQTWIHSLTHELSPFDVGKIREQVCLKYPNHLTLGPNATPQVGDSVALYFSFLSSYTKALTFPAILGIAFYLFSTSYSPLYSSLLLIWSIAFVEWWRIRERILSLRWGTRGSFLAEKHRVEWTPGSPWWRRDLIVAASIPVMFMFAGILAALLTAIFIFEVFVTDLYTGPGHTFVVSLFTPRTVPHHYYVPTLVLRTNNPVHCPRPTSPRNLPRPC